MSALEAVAVKPQEAEINSGASISPQITEIPTQKDLLSPYEKIILEAAGIAFNADISKPPEALPNWTDKTNEIIQSGYDQLTTGARHFTHFFTELGKSFQKCGTLQAMSRKVIEVQDLTAEKATQLSKVFDRWQVRAQGDVIFQRASLLPALLPILHSSKLGSNDMDMLIETLPIILPALAIASRLSGNRDEQYNNPASNSFSLPGEDIDHIISNNSGWQPRNTVRK